MFLLFSNEWNQQNEKQKAAYITKLNPFAFLPRISTINVHFCPSWFLSSPKKIARDEIEVKKSEN